MILSKNERLHFHIYIDESGVFAKLNESDNPEKGWATVGALAIPS